MHILEYYYVCALYMYLWVLSRSIYTTHCFAYREYSLDVYTRTKESIYRAPYMYKFLSSLLTISLSFFFVLFWQKKNGNISIFCILHINIIFLVRREMNTRATVHRHLYYSIFVTYNLGIGIIYVQKELE